MTEKRERYVRVLSSLGDWDDFLMKESGLPGPRANLELAHVVSELGDEKLFIRYVGIDAKRAPANSPMEFLPVCGAIGLGTLLAKGKTRVLKTLRTLASDSRWRTREAVAIALQEWGNADFDSLLTAMEQWATGTPLEQRAAAAALCEPKLLGDKTKARSVLKLLDTITTSLGRAKDRKSDQVQALKKGLAYCWSVAVAAFPEQGTRAMGKWLTSEDKDILWIMRENLKKNRLARIDSAWVRHWQKKLEAV